MQCITDDAGKPRKCDLCPIMLASEEVQLIGYSVFLCADCAEARLARIEQNERARKELSVK